MIFCSAVAFVVVVVVVVIVVLIIVIVDVVIIAFDEIKANGVALLDGVNRRCLLILD